MGVSGVEQWPDMREGKEEYVMFGLSWCIPRGEGLHGAKTYEYVANWQM